MNKKTSLHRRQTIQAQKNKNITTLDNNTKLRICQEALLRIGDRIIEVNGDTYILGYIHAVLDVLADANKKGL